MIPSYLKCHKCNSNIMQSDVVLSEPQIINPTEKQKICNHRWERTSSLRHSLDLFLDLGKSLFRN